MADDTTPPADAGANGEEQIVMTTGGIRALADVLATMREQQLRGHESTELELPYMAPELLTGHAPDLRADVFTIAAIARYLLTARPPFHASSLPELIGRMLTPAAAPKPAPPGVPPDAWQAIGRCLAADPATRPTLASLRDGVRGDLAH